MKVKLLKTNYPHLRGDTVEVKNDVGARWIKRGIAEEVKATPKPEPVESLTVDTTDQTPVVFEAPPENEAVDYDDMTVVKLRDLAKAEGVSIYSGGKTLNRAELIAALKDVE